MSRDPAPRGIPGPTPPRRAQWEIPGLCPPGLLIDYRITDRITDGITGFRSGGDVSAEAGESRWAGGGRGAQDDGSRTLLSPGRRPEKLSKTIPNI